MKLILQHGAQNVEFEFKAGDGQPLTITQATNAINYAYARWGRQLAGQPENPTVAQKASLLLELMADHMLNAARQQRRGERIAEIESELASELG